MCMYDRPTGPHRLTHRNKTGVAQLCDQFGQSFERVLHTEKLQKTSIDHRFELQKIQCLFTTQTYLDPDFNYLTIQSFLPLMICREVSISNDDNIQSLPALNLVVSPQPETEPTTPTLSSPARGWRTVCCACYASNCSRLLSGVSRAAALSWNNWCCPNS